MHKFCDYHQDRGHNTNDCYQLKKVIEEAVASGKLAHLVKDIRQGNQRDKGIAKGKAKVISMVRSHGYKKRPYERVEHWMGNEIAFPPIPRYQLVDTPIIVEATIEGFQVRRVYVDGGSSSEIMYEHCFRSFDYQTRSRLKESKTPLVGFSGEVSYPLGVIDLEVTKGEYGKTRTVLMEFAVVDSPSPYNVILGRTGMRSLGAVASTIHSMIKFPTSSGVATIMTSRETLKECMQIEGTICFRWKAQVSGFGRQRTTLGITGPESSSIPMADTSAESHDDPPAERAPVVEDILESSRVKEDPTPGPRAWRLYTDGALNDNGFGVGFILVAPDNVEYSYALRPNFSSSNNDIEYEALLAGLRIATEMQVKDIHALVDSKLVANQVEGLCETKGKKMKNYREKVIELAGSFDRFRISHVPRAQNKKTDALSKLAAVQFDDLSKEVLVEVPNERSIGNYYNKMVHHVHFKIGEFVLRKNEASKVERTKKLSPRWEGPYRVSQAFQSGACQLSDMRGQERPGTWGPENLRMCYM